MELFTYFIIPASFNASITNKAPVSFRLRKLSTYLQLERYLLGFFKF